MLGPVGSVARAVAVLVLLFLIIKRSTTTYAPGATPRWWRV